MQIVFHLGFHKTGSSSIQKFLFDFRETLLKLEILYPNNGVVGSAHHGIIWSIKPSSLAKFHSFKPDTSCFEKIAQEAKKNEIRKIILSSEFFSNLKMEDIYIIKSELTKHFSFIPVVIIYIRRQDIAIESLYKQVTKTYETREKRNFHSYLSQDWIRSFLNFAEILSQWQQVFPEAQIIPRIYDRKLFPEGNVIIDFLSAIDVDIPEVRKYKIEANPSLSHLSALVMKKINEKFDLSFGEHDKAIQYLLRLDKKEGSPIKTFFTLPERMEFLEHFRESNIKLFNKWFGTDNKFVLSEEEVLFYEEQDKIHQEEIDRIVEDRYRKVLTYLMEEGAKPKVHFERHLKPIINYHPLENVELMNIDVFQVDLLRGKVTIGGLVLLKKEVEGKYSLTARVGREEKTVNWELPSPGLAARYPDNPKAKVARFQISDLDPSFTDIEILLNGVRVITITVLK